MAEPPQVYGVFLRGKWENDNFGSSNGLYQWMSLYGSAVNGGEAAYYKVQNENLELKWETNSSLNIGLETRLFNRVNLSFEYYNKHSDDLLFKFIQPLSAGATDSSTGLSTVWRNIGDVSNKGWEFSADGDIIRNREWEWNVGLNLSKVKNKIGKLPDKDREEGITNGDFQKFKEGHSIYEFWLYQYAGVDQMTGRSVYLPDFNAYYIAGEDGKTPVNGEESTEGKKSDSDRQLGRHQRTILYRRPEICTQRLVGQFITEDKRLGHHLSPLERPDSVRPDDFQLRFQSLRPALSDSDIGRRTFIDSRFTECMDSNPRRHDATSPNRLDPSGIPQVNLDATINGYNSQKASTRYIVSGDYLSIKNITLSYRLPATWSKRLTLGGIRLHAAIENVALFSKRKG